MPSIDKIIITGANGLLGRHCVEVLSKNNEVFAVVHNDVNSKIDGVNYIYLDLSSDWDASVLPESVDVVIHLAQSSKFREFPNKALDIFSVNVSSTARLLDYAAANGARRFIYASSGGVYGTGANAFNENSPIVPHGQLGYYLASKLCAEVLVQNYSHLLDVSIMRLFFMYGAGQRRSMLIPRLVDNIKNGDPVVLQGDEGIRINPINVLDAVSSVKACLDADGSHTFNIAGPEVLSLKEVALIIGSKLGVEPVFTCEDKPPNDLIADINMMKAMLHAPCVNLSTGIDDLLS